MKLSYLTFLTLVSFQSLAVTSSCDKQKWKLSTLELSISDPYTETTLSFSYGPEIKNFIKKMSGAISRYYYEDNQMNSKFTFVSTYYSNDGDAKEAYDHLKNRTKNARAQDVYLKDKQIVWFAGRQLEDTCFQSIKKEEIKNIK